MNENIDLEDYIDVIEPDGLNEARLKEWEFLKDYVPIKDKSRNSFSIIVPTSATLFIGT